GVFVTVDGRAVARALARDRADRLLPVWLGCRIVRPREIFLINAAPDSLDGRYFGPLPTIGLLGTAHPILTRDAPCAPLRWRPSGRDPVFPRSEKE
ncbi:MAG: S26 family signal peptidase, partial [Sphingopyxis sp.]|nr:S26 family signal peptidase [Sphingopyxis sp.]